MFKFHIRIMMNFIKMLMKSTNIILFSKMRKRRKKPNTYNYFSHPNIHNNYIHSQVKVILFSAEYYTYILIHSLPLSHTPFFAQLIERIFEIPSVIFDRSAWLFYMTYYSRYSCHILSSYTIKWKKILFFESLLNKINM